MSECIALRLEHLRAPADSPRALQRLAEILGRPSFAPLVRAASEQRSRRVGHCKPAPAALLAILQNPRSHALVMDSGRSHEDDYLAMGRIECLYPYEVDPPGGKQPVPLGSYIALPHDPASTAQRLADFHALAVALDLVAGCISVEPDMSGAHGVALGQRPPRPELALQQPGMTMQRWRERRAYPRHPYDRADKLIGPEWGLYLGRGHLATLSADAIEASGAFHAVERLGDDLLFVQLTADPGDSLRPDFDSMLDRARAALAPLLVQELDLPAE